MFVCWVVCLFVVVLGVFFAVGVFFVWFFWSVCWMLVCLFVGWLFFCVCCMFVCFLYLFSVFSFSKNMVNSGHVFIFVGTIEMSKLMCSLIDNHLEIQTTKITH